MTCGLRDGGREGGYTLSPLPITVTLACGRELIALPSECLTPPPGVAYVVVRKDVLGWPQRKILFLVAHHKLFYSLCIKEQNVIFFGPFIAMFSIVEHPRKRDIPVLAYTIAASTTSLHFFT